MAKEGLNRRAENKTARGKCWICYKEKSGDKVFRKGLIVTERNYMGESKRLRVGAKSEALLMDLS